MAKLDIAVPHSLAQDEALVRIKRLLGEVKKQHADKIADLTERWDGNVGKFKFQTMGYDITGTLTVESSAVKLSGDLPWAASFFKGKITSIVTERAQTLLA